VSPSGPYPVGQTMVTLTVQDPAGLSDSCPATITVNDCQPPTIQCPDNITVGNDPGQCTAVVNYTVTASDNCPGVMVACDPPSGHAFPMGTTTVNCLATDAAGNTTPCSFTVTVEDREAPTLSVSVTTTQMWPANHDLINVGLSISATDNCDGNLASRAVIRVYSDEDDELETGDGNHSPDAKPGHEFGGDAGPLRLRAERQNSGDGRVYLILVTVRDNAGNSTTRCATVTVPKSNSAANRASVAAQAAAAAAACPNVPAGFVPVGDGAPVGPKQ